MKKSFALVLLGAILLAGGLAYWQWPKPAARGPQVTGLPMVVGSNYWPGQFWIEIADKKGWFEEAGLNVQLVDTTPDYLQSLQDMVDGKMDVNQFVLFDLMKFNAQGADLVAVFQTDHSAGADAIVVKEGIRRTQDLRGKRIAVSKGTFMEHFLAEALAGAKLRIEDVILRENKPAVLDAFLQGDVDAIVTFEPFVSEAIQEGRGRRLLDTRALPGVIADVCAFHQGFIEQRPQDVQAFVNVWHRTTAFIKDNPKEAFGIIATIYNKPLSDVEAMARETEIFALRENLSAFEFGSGVESLHGLSRRINDFMIKRGMTKEQMDSTEFLDARFIRDIANTEK